MTDLAAFHDLRFPTGISFGATGGPQRRNEIVSLTSGREVRNVRHAHSRRVYDAGTGIRSIDDIAEIVAFFEARRGSLHGFRFRDPFDMKSCPPSQMPSAGDQLLGVGDGTAVAFQLLKTYGEGEDAYRRPITRPVAGTVRIAVSGDELAASAFAVEPTGGLVTLDFAPAPDAEIRAGFEFDVPVRFDAERLDVSLSGFRAGQIPTIPIIEIRE